MTTRLDISALLAQSENLESRFSRWQTETPDESEIQLGQREYHEWYERARQVIPEADGARFKDMYEGGTFVHRLSAFLANPLAINPFYNPEDTNPLLNKYTIQFEPICRESLVVQRQILTSALHHTADVVLVLDELTNLFGNLTNFLTVLRQAGNPKVPPPTLENEYDLQILVHAILRLKYNDVRAEDPASQHAGAACRIDFVLPTVGVMVETKMTRPSLKDKRLGEELVVDWERYRRHPNCRAIFALVYNPERLLKNPVGLASDLSQNEGTPATRVLIIA
jgi:hypothetical protein